MKTKPLALRILALGALVQLATTSRAAAYIDPGSGSFFVQMLLAGLLGAGMAIKAYWGRIRSFFGFKSTPPPDDEAPQ
ncbi:MAG: hypothetical protein OEM67_11760 [Thermoleophilia bacterium]|nr:hypothetical protein [Thermoleophilia bacterium]